MNQQKMREQFIRSYLTTVRSAAIDLGEQTASIVWRMPPEIVDQLSHTDEKRIEHASRVLAEMSYGLHINLDNYEEKWLKAACEGKSIDHYKNDESERDLQRRYSLVRHYLFCARDAALIGGTRRAALMCGLSEPLVKLLARTASDRLVRIIEEYAIAGYGIRVHFTKAEIHWMESALTGAKLKPKQTDDGVRLEGLLISIKQATGR